VPDEARPRTIDAPQAGRQYPRSGRVSAALVVGAVAVLAAAVAALWSTRRSWPSELPIVQLVPFGGLLLVMGLLAARTRLMLHDLRRLTESLHARLDAFRTLDESLQDTRGSLHALGEKAAAIDGMVRVVEQLRHDLLDLRNQVATMRDDVATIKQTALPPGTQPVDARSLADAISGVRDDVAALERRLRESVARIRYDIEDDKMLLVDLLGGNRPTPGSGTGNEMDGSLER